MSISPGLRNFFEAEIANEEAMRREAGHPGSEEYEVASRDPKDDLYVGQADLDSAWHSWIQAPEDVLADFIRVADLLPAEAQAAAGERSLASLITEQVGAVEQELRDLIEARGGGTLLTDLLGYTALAEQRREDAAERREQARRRRPSWADEE